MKIAAFVLIGIAVVCFLAAHRWQGANAFQSGAIIFVVLADAVGAICAIAAIMLLLVS